MWVFGGANDCSTDVSNDNNDIFELTLLSLTWTQIHTGQPCPELRHLCTLTALPDEQLVLHGGKQITQPFSDTWLMDLKSQTWRKLASRKDHVRWSHTGLSGLSSSVIIFGGFTCDAFNDTCEVYSNIFHMMLEPKCPQQLAVKVIHKHLNDLPWKLLPVKLISLLGLYGRKRARCRITHGGKCRLFKTNTEMLHRPRNTACSIARGNQKSRWTSRSCQLAQRTSSRFGPPKRLKTILFLKKQNYRVATVREKVREKNIFSRSWKSQGILLQVSENELF